MRFLRPAALLLTGWFVASATAQSDVPSPKSRPHLVVILLDDMGYGDPGCYNVDSKIPTPHLDSLARDGMRFTDAHAPGPLCHLSRYGLLTGRYPFRTDVGRWPKHALIEPGQTTLASLAKSAGYRTAMVGKWHLGFEEDGYDQPLPGGPVDVGFDSFFGIRASTDIPPYFYIRDRRAVMPPTEQIEANQTAGWSPIQGAFWRAGGIAPDLELAEVLPRFTTEAETVIADHATSHADDPLMLYVAFPAPHTPWLPDEAFRGKSGAGLYGDFLMMVDHMVGRLLGSLERAGMADDAIVVCTSDNGPVWYRDDVERFGHDSCGGLRGMKADAWEAGHRMPFLVRWPGVVAPGSVSDQTICFTDLLATFAEILETELPADAGPDSFSFLPVLRGQRAESDPVRPSTVMQTANGTTVVRMGDWKWISHLGSGGFSEPKRITPESGGPTSQLYHLRDDPAETNNLASSHPEMVSRLKAEGERVRSSGHSRN